MARPTFDILLSHFNEFCDQHAIAAGMHKIFEWLMKLGKPHYASHFLRNGIINWQAIETLTMDDLVRMEIPHNDSEEIMQSIGTMRNVLAQPTKHVMAV